MRKNVYKAICTHLPKDSSREHHLYKSDNEAAASWVEHHMMSRRVGEDASKDKFKFLVGCWTSTAGYEVPTLIFVTDSLDKPRFATHVQRAKAKLIIYQHSKLDD